jgi:hypothetical protein
MFRRVSLIALLGALAFSARALDDSSLRLLSHAWPPATATKVSEIGRGIGVVFSPDLSVKNNCAFYETLGFACFEDTDWSRILDNVHRHNVLYPEAPVHTLVLETHGTNGNGLKVQTSYTPTAERSYIAVGALQERLEPDGVDYVIISACNSGRLLRPEIYSALDRNNGDRLFLTPTCGIVDASGEFDPQRTGVTIVTPRSSHIETTIVGRLRELPLPTRRAVLAAAKAKNLKLPAEFAISDLMVQMITRDRHIDLAANSYVEQLSRDMTPQDNSERNFRSFLRYLNAVAARESGKTGLVAAKAPAKKKVRTGTPSRKRVTK